MTNRRDEVAAAAERIRDQVSRQPYLTLGLAGAVGYFVGRGVSMNVLATLFGVSARTALGSAVESFLRDAERILRDADDAARSAARVARGESGHLSIGFLGATDAPFLPKLLRNNN